MTRRLHPAVASLALAVALAAGCSDESPAAGPASFAEVDPFPTTHMLTKSDVATLTRAEDDGTLVFAAPAPAIASATVGHVLVGGPSAAAPNGLLRVVLAADHDASGALVLTTAAAPLQLAFRRVHARNLGNIDPIASGAFRKTDTSPLSRSPSFGLQPRFTVGDVKTGNFQVVVFDGDGNLATTNDQVTIDATLRGGFRFDLSIDIDWGAVREVPKVVQDCLGSIGKIVKGELPKCSVEDFLPEMKLSFEVDPVLGAAVKAAGAASLPYEKEIDVGTLDLPPVEIGPLVFLPSADILAKISGRASARFSASAHADVEVQSRAVLSSKIKNTQLDPFRVTKAEAGAETPQVDLYASVTAKLGVRLNLALFGIAGPYAMASAVTELTANPTSNPCFDLELAMEAQVGVRVTSPKLPLLGYVTFIDWHADPFRPFEKSVANGSCTTTPEGARPPGGGPGAAVLQSPPFQPWAKVFAGPADGSAVEQVGAFSEAFPMLHPSVDGRFIATGGAARAIYKLDDHADGSVVWSKQVLPDSALPKLLQPLGSVPSADAGLITLWATNDGFVFVVTKQGQAGDFIVAREYDLPPACVGVPSTIANDAAGGVVVAGWCRNAGTTWFAHLDGALSVVRVAEMVDSDPNAIHVRPTTLVRSAESLVVAGERTRGGPTAADGSEMFVLRLDDQESVSAPASFACPERVGLYPTAITPSLDGAVTVAGHAGGVGYVSRITKEGQLGFATFPNIGTGTRYWFVPGAVAELPTTGLVAAFSSGVLGDAPPVVALVGLDGAGHPQWANSYALSTPAGLRAVAWPALRVTDDGGLVVAAWAGPEVGATEGGALVGMKVFARDGTLGPGQALTQGPLTLADGSYVVSPRPFAPTMRPMAATEQPFAFNR